MSRRITPFAVGLVLIAFFALWPVSASAKGGRPEVRVAGSCGSGATSSLRLRGGDGGIEVRFEVDHARAGIAWRVVLVHERRVAWKGAASTARPGGSFEVQRILPDLPGADAVTVSAWGPKGLVCRATATLSGS
jgi:hypothetical protein